MQLLKKILRPIWRPMCKVYSQRKIKFNTFDVSIEKLLRGGENGIRAAKYAELTQNFLRPSTSVFEGPHVKLLQLYDEIKDEVFQQDVFQNTDYYKNSVQCMRLTGAYFYDRPEKIKTLAQRFVHQHKGMNFDLPSQPGQSESNQPIWVRPIKHSSCYEVIDGNHRIARAIMRGNKTIPALVYDKEPILTPLQQLLLDCLWINKQNWLYQPVIFPELKDQWTLVRNCDDRLQMMTQFLQKYNIVPNEKTYLDIGSSYGWFVKKFSELGFHSFGMERDPFGMDIGFKVFGINKNQIIHSDISIGLENLIQKNQSYDVVSCLSVLHHFVLQKSSISAESFIKLIDKTTKNVLFIDTGEEHEDAFEGTLKGWSPEFIQKWLLNNTTFDRVIPLGVDQDRKYPFQGYYKRTLFACVR